MDALAKRLAAAAVAANGVWGREIVLVLMLVTAELPHAAFRRWR